MTWGNHNSESSRTETWLVVDPADVPERWRHRSMQVTVVRLSPEEARRILSTDHARPLVASEDAALAHLVASGLGVTEMSEQLHLTARSIYRRLARLRREMGVGTIGELASKLSRLGY